MRRGRLESEWVILLRVYCRVYSVDLKSNVNNHMNVGVTSMSLNHGEG